MVKIKIKKGDKVEIIAGKDRGKTGKALAVYPKKGRLVVEGRSLIKRHARPTQKEPKGGVKEREGTIHISNVMLVCPSCGKGTRVGRRNLEDKRVRVCKRCGAEIDKV